MITNHTIDALLERRSVRAYRAEQISDEELSDILLTARYAPSSMGQQARHITVIQNKKLLNDIIAETKKIGEQNGRTFAPDYTPFYNAPTVIAFSAPQVAKYGREDVACAIMNLMTAAHAYGLGTCYIGSATGLGAPEIVEQLHLPAGYVPFGCVTVGYPLNMPPAAAPRREDDINYIM